MQDAQGCWRRSWSFGPCWARGGPAETKRVRLSTTRQVHTHAPLTLSNPYSNAVSLYHRIMPTLRATRLPKRTLLSGARRTTVATRLHSSLQAGQSSVNPDEIAHFSKLSQMWWDERGEFGLLHKMNPVRMEFVRQKVVRLRSAHAVYTHLT